MTSFLYSAADLYVDCGYGVPDYVDADEFCRGGSGSGAGPSIGNPVPTRRSTRPERPTAETAAILQRQAPPQTGRERLIADMAAAKAQQEADEAEARLQAYLVDMEKQRRRAMADEAINAYAPDQRGTKIVVQTPKGPRLMTVEQAVRAFYRNQG